MAENNTTFNDNFTTPIPESLSTGNNPPCNECIPMAAIYIIFSIVGTTGNILVILSVTCQKRLWRTSNFYILVLALADCLLCALVMPMQGAVSLIGRDLAGCALVGALDSYFLTVSVLALTAVAVNRYYLNFIHLHFSENA